jgi:hypothetical protein
MTVKSENYVLRGQEEDLKLKEEIFSLRKISSEDEFKISNPNLLAASLLNLMS